MPNSLTDWFHQRASRAPRTRASFGQSVGQSRLEARGRITCRFRPVMVRKVEWNKKLGKLGVSGGGTHARMRVRRCNQLATAVHGGPTPSFLFLCRVHRAPAGSGALHGDAMHGDFFAARRLI